MLHPHLPQSRNLHLKHLHQQPRPLQQPHLPQSRNLHPQHLHQHLHPQHLHLHHKLSKVYDLEFFRSYRNFTAKWPQHSAALKFFRKKLQQDGLNELMFDGTEEIARIIHPAGTDYHFDESVMFHWDWVGMIAQLADESLVTLLQSQDGANRSRRIVACGIKMMPRYSHQLQCAQGVRGGPVQQVWDFVLEHEDGSTTSLHPQWSKTKVACIFGESPVDFEVPRSGPGGTSGPGTFNQFKNKHIDQWLKFDAQKKPPTECKSKAKPTATKAATPAVAEPKEGQPSAKAAAGDFQAPPPARPPPLP